MGATLKKRVFTALLFLAFTNLFHPRFVQPMSSNVDPSLFKQAAVSLEHAESVDSHLSRDICSGRNLPFILNAFQCAGPPSGSYRIAGKGFSSPAKDFIFEFTMDEEVVAEPPEDMYEEEDIPLPVDLNKRVEQAIRYFQMRARPHFKEWHRRFGKYEKRMKKILRSEGVPGDFVYLAMIESGFSPNAVSRAGAVGIWQFMYWTGKKFGLRVNWWDDERRDFERSTRAAAKYLKSLYDMFGSWYLAAAAYNVGEGKIDRAIRRYRTDDYWKLVTYRYLPRETKNYVPKMLAALTIVKDPKSYGFNDLELDSPMAFDVAELPGAIDLRTVSEIIGVDYDDVRSLNPGLRRGVIPPDVTTYTIRLPKGRGPVVEQNIEEIERRGRVKFVLHKMGAQDNIHRVAQKYSADVTKIREVNGLGSNRIGGRSRLIIPIVGETVNTIASSFKPADPASLRRVVSSLERSARYYYVYRHGNRMIYRVKKGDSLYKIARRFGISIPTLRRLNGLGGNIIRPGQQLTIRLFGMKSAKSPGKKESIYTYQVMGGQKIYTVKSGNTLFSIGRGFGISVRDLKQMNGLKGEVIRPGMKLVVGYTG